MKSFPISDASPEHGFHTVVHMNKKTGKTDYTTAMGDSGASVVRFLRESVWPIVSDQKFLVLCVLPGIWPLRNRKGAQA